MDFYRNLLCRALGEKAYELLGLAEMDCTEILALKSMQALEEIRAVISNDSLSDFDCIEEIVCIFEHIGSDGGNRHDFG